MFEALMGWFSRILIDYKARQMGLTKKTTRTADGRWTYFTGGQGPAMVFIHGYGANKENWLAIAPKLMKRYTVYVPDLIGFGESDRPAGARYNVLEQSGRVVRWAKSIGVQRFHVMGNSMGGYIAGTLAARHSDSILSACLLNPAGVAGAEHTEVGKAFMEQGKVILAPSNFQEYQYVVDLCFNHKAPPMPGFLRRYFGGISIRNKALLDQIFMEFVNPEGNPTLNELVAEATIPMMVVWGDSDLLVHCSGLGILKQANPKIVDLMLENTGHCPMVDRSGAVAKAHQAFVGG